MDQERNTKYGIRNPKQISDFGFSLQAACGLLGLTLCLLTTSCKPPAAKPPPPPRVTVSHPQLSVVTNWDEYPGHIEAVEMVELRPRVAGYIESIDFEDGAEVKIGDPLFLIDPKPYQAELDRAEAQRKQVEIRLELAHN